MLLGYCHEVPAVPRLRRRARDERSGPYVPCPRGRLGGAGPGAAARGGAEAEKPRVLAGGGAGQRGGGLRAGGTEGRGVDGGGAAEARSCDVPAQVVEGRGAGGWLIATQDKFAATLRVAVPPAVSTITVPSCRSPSGINSWRPALSALSYRFVVVGRG